MKMRLLNAIKAWTSSDPDGLFTTPMDRETVLHYLREMVKQST